MQLRFNACRWQEDSGGFWLCLLLPRDKREAVSEFVRTFNEKLHVADIKQHREKRSLDSNAYFWVLAGKLAAVMGISPNEIYRQYIPDIGDNFVVIPVKEDKLEQMKRMWCDGHIGRMCDDLGECRRTKGYHNMRCYISSSDYDTAQMSRLINMLVEDCKAQGIETLTPDEIAKMMEQWQR